MLQIRRSQQLQKMINVTVGNFPKRMSDFYKSDDIGSFPFNKISEIPRAQWNGTFRWHRLDPSHRVFGYWKKRTVLGTTILSNEKGHFGPTDRNDQADQSRPPSKLAPNIPIWSNQNGPYHLMYVPTEIYGISQGCVPLGWSGSGLMIGDHSDHGRSRLFTIYKNFPGIRLESKWNTTF